MNKYVMMLAAAGLVSLAPALAKAEDMATTAAPAAESMAEVAVEAKEAMLKDGTKVSIEGDAVFVVAADGTKTAAPDGEHELADGTKVKTAGGKIVKEEMMKEEMAQ